MFSGVKCVSCLKLEYYVLCKLKKCQVTHKFIYFLNRMVSIMQELGTVKAADGKLDFEKYPIGSVLFIYPWHVCFIKS